MENKRLKRKSPIAAALLSAFVFAGMGQIYIKQYIKGVFLAAVYALFLFLTLKPMILSYQAYLTSAANVETQDLSKVAEQMTPKPNLALVIFLTIIWLYSIVDAFISAKKYNSSLGQLGDTASLI